MMRHRPDLLLELVTSMTPAPEQGTAGERGCSELLHSSLAIVVRWPSLTGPASLQP